MRPRALAAPLSSSLLRVTSANLHMHESITHTQFAPTIHPKEAFANQTYHGKVVLITGASRGIGQVTAITYAKADAQVTLVGRSQETLDETAAAMRAAVSEAQVLAVPADAVTHFFSFLEPSRSSLTCRLTFCIIWLLSLLFRSFLVASIDSTLIVLKDCPVTTRALSSTYCTQLQ
ncbi:hypothetical protein EDB83DRAFT_1551666 [Lactarius deliciosus]|nr:hypothetical protein EDB83DRAFT_1551666 [Lactarius deliciosus]